MRRVAALLLLLLPRLGMGQARLVSDIAVALSSYGDSSYPYQLTVAGGKLYFTATTADLGSELWRTDGTAAGTVLVADLRLGPDSSSPSALKAFGSSLIFIATTEAGSALWITQGTAATTKPIAPASDPWTAVAGGRILFITRDGSNNNVLWSTDGTADGTQVVAALDDGLLTYTSVTTPAFGGIVFATQRALWFTDGTAAGTRRIHGGHTSTIIDLAAAGDRLFFRDYEKLWVSDGTAAGTHTVTMAGTMPAVGSVYQHLQPIGGRVIFLADGAQGFGPWISDGTDAGTFQLAGGFTKYQYPSMTAFNGVVYMVLSGVNYRAELWRTDGTVAGTVRVQGIGDDSTRAVGAFNGALWLAGNGLLRSDGTAAGTVKLTDNPYNAIPSAALDGRVYFPASDNAHGDELWSTDGTRAGTAMVADVQPNIGASSNPTFVAATDGQIVVNTGDPQNPVMVVSDGTAAGTVSIGPANPTRGVVAFRGSIYVLNNTGDLFRIERSGTRTLVKHFGFYNYGSLAVAGDALYIAGSYSSYELWRSDGTAAGTTQISDGSYIPSLTGDFAGHLLISTDRDTDGTRPPHVMYRLPTGASTNRVAIGGGTLYLIVGFANHWQLWKSNGTPLDTKLIKDLPGAKLLNTATTFAATTTQLFFAMDDGHGAGMELWRTDGTEAGTYLVKDIRIGSASSNPDNFAIVDDKLLFTADDGVFGREPWISDGTTAGTQMLKDIAPLSASSTSNGSVPFLTTLHPQPLAANGYGWFAADDGIHGAELWRTDGTPGGTMLAADVGEGSFSSWPQPMAMVGGSLFMAATTIATGRELWALPLSDVAVSIADGRALESAGTATLTVSLSAPATAPVTAQWSADNGAGGTIAFAAGESRAQIIIPISGDGVAAGNRVVYVRLRDVRGARAAKSVAALLLEDADVRADVSVAFDWNLDGSPKLVVTNAGPNGATDLHVRAVSDASSTGSDGTDLAAGSSTVSPALLPLMRYFLRGSATALQRDPNPSNNAATLQQTYLPGAQFGLAVTPAWLAPGQHGTLHVQGVAGTVMKLTSSRPDIVAVPASVDAPANVDIVARAAGSATIEISDGYGTQSLTIPVIETGQAIRWPAHLTLSLYLTSLYYGAPRLLTAYVSQPAPDTGDVATGTVAFSAGGQVLATVPLDTIGRAQTTASTLLPGTYDVIATYSGDAHFLPDSTSLPMTVLHGPPNFAAFADAKRLTIVAVGFGGIFPTGKVTVTQDTRVLAENVPLDEHGMATFDVDVGSLKTAPYSNQKVIQVKYSGDSFYLTGVTDVPIQSTHRHVTR